MSPGSVSVVIPAYNSKDTIGLALESVFNQTYRVQETLVIDDGSLDGTADWVRERFDWVHVITVPNGGPSAARNVGIQQAQGEWVAFLDADDQWHNRKIEIEMQIIDGKEDVGLVATDWDRRLDVDQPVDLRDLRLTEISYRDMLRLNQFQTSTVLMKKCLLDELNGFDSGVDGAEDWDLWLRASTREAVWKVGLPLVLYRDVSHGYSKDVWRVFQTMQPMLEKHRHNNVLSPQEFKQIETWHHLRFLVAFMLMREKSKVRNVVGLMRQKQLGRYVIPATIRYLTPFLLRRAARKLKK